MFFCFIFFSLYLVTAKQIKNMNVPSCRNCIYYKPQPLQPYISPYSKCEFFGSKDINSDIISKSENNGVITIVIDDESELDPNVKLTPIFTIDKNNNSVTFSSIEDGTNFIYKFLEFTINIQ